MEIIVKINSTNGTTMLDAFEKICGDLKKFTVPVGTTSTEFWKIEVIKTDQN